MAKEVPTIDSLLCSKGQRGGACNGCSKEVSCPERSGGNILQLLAASRTISRGRWENAKIADDLLNHQALDWVSSCLQLKHTSFSSMGGLRGPNVKQHSARPQVWWLLYYTHDLAENMSQSNGSKLHTQTIGEIQ